MSDALNSQHARLVMQANILGDQSNALMLAAKLIQEYRGLVQALLAENKLLLDLHERKIADPNGPPVPRAAPAPAESDLRGPAGGGGAGGPALRGPSLERDSS